MARASVSSRISGIFTTVFGKEDYEAAEQEEMEKERLEENRASDVFYARINADRASQYNSGRTDQLAPGFDYINWKPYGCKRRNDTHIQKDRYFRTCESLRPFVLDVVRSSCQGEEERRWARLTGMPEDQRGPEYAQQK